ncbi:hypothetical protein ACLKMH_18170 [Psychromonas sp. KJ10-10]|uniref:hypothetical protein n=1 Tax=Psychromonas sp. KJ10-10 TaxID=3391823 RepID=UPI0039B4C932
MSNPFLVLLSFEPASSLWDEDALISFSENKVTIHLDKASPLYRQVQSVARKLDGMSLRNLKLDGEHWDVELRWAFSQGLFNAKKGAQLSFGDISEEELQQLTSRKLIVEWVRNTINLGPEALYPELLCSKSADLIKHVLADESHLKYEIISGEALLEQEFHGIYQVGRGSSSSACYVAIGLQSNG